MTNLVDAKGTPGITGTKVHLRKFHLVNEEGTITVRHSDNYRKGACSRDSLKVEKFNSFHSTAKNYPEVCCQTCLKYYNEKIAEIKKLQGK
jgi:hypothetical protein